MLSIIEIDLDLLGGCVRGATWTQTLWPNVISLVLRDFGFLTTCNGLTLVMSVAPAPLPSAGRGR